MIRVTVKAYNYKTAAYVYIQFSLFDPTYVYV